MAKDRKTASPHRAVLERTMGRPLLPSEVVDHRDEDKDNNAPSNLSPEDRAAHTARHNRTRGLSKLRTALRMVSKGQRLY